MQNTGGKLLVRDGVVGPLGIRVGDELPSGISIGDELPSGVSGTTTDLMLSKVSGKITFGVGDVALRAVGSHLSTVSVGLAKMTKTQNLKGQGSSLIFNNPVVDEFKNFSLITSLRLVDSMLGALHDSGTVRSFVTIDKGAGGKPGGVIKM